MKPKHADVTLKVTLKLNAGKLNAGSVPCCDSILSLLRWIPVGPKFGAVGWWSFLIILIVKCNHNDIHQSSHMSSVLLIHNQTWEVIGRKTKEPHGKVTSRSWCSNCVKNKCKKSKIHNKNCSSIKYFHRQTRKIKEKNMTKNYLHGFYWWRW